MNDVHESESDIFQPGHAAAGLRAGGVVDGGCPVTYQGRLLDQGEPANGKYRFEFAVYDAPQDGNQIGPTLVVNDVAVSEGLFTVHLDVRDFDLSGIDPDTRPYVQIAVEGEVLTPRQPITMAPYAALAAYVRDPNVARLTGDQTFWGSNTFAGDTALGDDPNDTVVCSGSLEAAEVRVAGAVACERVAASDSCALGDDPNDTVVCSGSLEAREVVAQDGVFSEVFVDNFGRIRSGFFEELQVAPVPSVTYTVEAPTGVAPYVMHLGIRDPQVTATAVEVLHEGMGDGLNVRLENPINPAAAVHAVNLSPAGFAGLFQGRVHVAGHFSADDTLTVDAQSENVTVNGRLVVAPDPSVTYTVEAPSAVAPYIIRLGIEDPAVPDTGIEVVHQGVGDGVSVRLDNPINPAAAVHAVNLSPAGFAGLFQGRVHVAGQLTAVEKLFKIDHPLDPANKYLVHSCVESPERKNVYDGVVTTDDRGDAEVVLSDYFEALNGDFRYQLTVLGQFAQAIVAREIQNNRFWIKTDKPRVKVCWQVTGVRRDPYAVQNPLQVEQPKSQSDRDGYLSPAADGQPADRLISGGAAAPRR